MAFYPFPLLSILSVQIDMECKVGKLMTSKDVILKESVLQ